MSVEVLDESGTGADVAELARLSRFVLDRMRLHPQTELCLRLVDEDTIGQLNERWMDTRGPTDVLAFPMDELTPGSLTDVLHGADDGDDDGDEPPEAEAYLGDLVLCPAVAARQAGEHGHSTADETDLLTVHGILHLLGYDHAEPDGHREMFALQERLLTEWRDVRADRADAPGTDRTDGSPSQ